MNIVSAEFKVDPFPFLARLNKLLSEPSLMKPAVEELLRYTDAGCDWISKPRRNRIRESKRFADHS